jgi:hypothetical protein
MAFQQMYQQLLGVAGTNLGLAKTFVNEALTYIQDENTWSFQVQTNGWLTPNLLGGNTAGDFLSPGTITVIPYTQTITGDAVATAAWTEGVPYPPLLTQQQIRVPYYSLYNIIALGNNGTVAYATILTAGSGQTPGTYLVSVTDASGPGLGATVSITVNANGTVTIPPIVTNVGSGYVNPIITFSEGGTPTTFSVTLIATLTIDRPWTDMPIQSGGYLIYQAYYPAPANFRRWISINDYTNNALINWWEMTRADLDIEDPQRTEFDQPEFAVPYGADTRQGSATYGQMMFELYPHPISQLGYTFVCLCNLPPLVNPTDTVPFPLTDEVVKWRALEVLYQWCESQKGTDVERGSGANWQFLSQAARKEYEQCLKKTRLKDRNLVDLYYQKARLTGPYDNDSHTNTNGTASVGWFGR